MKKPSIQILDTDLSNRHSISGYNSLEFTRAWNSQGYFKLVINKANPTAKYLATDKILYIDEKRIGYIKKRNFSEKDNKANALIIIEGVELKDELARITYPAAGQTTDSYDNEYTETIVKSLINKNAGASAADVLRRIPNLEISSDNNRGPQVFFSTRYKDLISEIYKLLVAALMGLRCSIDFNDLKIIFDVAEGNDKKAVPGVSAGVVLSVDLKTADEVEAIEDKSGYRNVAIAAGLGSGTERTISEVGDTDKSGYGRSETFLDARDIASDTELSERGNQRLAETKIVKGKTIKFNEVGPRKLDEAFTLGDFITAEVEGIYEDAQVIKITEVYAGVAAPDVSLVLDFDYMDSLAKSFKVNNENNKNVVASDSPSGGGSSTFIEQSDTPATYTGQAKKIPRVNAAVDALEFKDLGEIINDATAKTIPADADTIGLSDSADSNKIKKFSWADYLVATMSWLNERGFCIFETLTANRTYYTKPGSGPVTGSGTLADPFTGSDVIQYVLDIIGALNISTFNITVDLWSATGTGTVTYVLTTGHVLKSAIGSGIIYIIGNSSNQDSVVLDVNGNTGINNTPLGQTFVLKNFQMYDAATTEYGLLMSNYGYIELDGIHFNGIKYPARAAINGARIGVFNRDNATKITGSPSFCFWVNPQGELFISDGTLDTTALISFNYFYLAENLGLIRMSNSTNYTTTAIPGQKWYVLGNAVLDVNANTVPGNTAGVPAIGTSPYGGQVR